jgi:hypothetical protein
MRLTLLGHSCLHVETRAGSILVDPWLFGSAGWRSWWHYPPCAVEDRHLRPDFVYLTHHHPDHFHYPSMRRLDKGAHVLIPRFGVDVMRGEVAGLGFARVSELPHGEPLELAPGVRVASYQYGFDDTTFVVQEDAHVVVDLNDCKIRGAPIRRIAREFGLPTFCLKGYSFAQAYPHCYTAEDPADLGLVSRETYLDDFVYSCRELAPRYAIPFASMVAFLHPEAWHANAHALTPGEVATAFAGARQAGRVGDTELVCMQPGDSWDSETGFAISETDWYREKDRHLRALAEQVRPKIQASLAEEARRQLDWESFARYFGGFARALPPLVGRLLAPRPIVFHVPSSPQPYFALDLAHRRLSRHAEPPPGRASLIRVAEGVLADAIDKRIVAMLHGTMRLRAELRPGGVNEDLAFWGLLAVWELGYLPWTRLLGRRCLGVAWRRRAEAAELVRALVARGSPTRRLAGRLASPPRASDPAALGAPGGLSRRDAPR